MHQVFLLKYVLELWKSSTYFSQEVEFIAEDIEVEVTPNFTSPTRREVCPLRSDELKTLTILILSGQSFIIQKCRNIVHLRRSMQ